ncbi:MAG: XrtA system polysaccharide chain length determinant [Burkholderiaceae bacterium]
MNQIVEELLIALRAVWRRRWLAIGVMWSTAVLGMAIVWLVPNRYEANARVYVDTQTVLKPLMSGLAFQPDTDQQVKMLARTLVSRPNVDHILKVTHATPVTTGLAHEQAIDRLIERIKVDPSGGNLYVISVRDTDPAAAKAVVAALVDLFVGNGTEAKQRDSSEAGSFIDDQIKAYETKLSEAEGRLKDFKIRNFGVTGVSTQDYFSRTSTIADEVTRLQIAYAAAEQARDALRRELASEDPHLPADAANPVVAPVPTELDARIDAQKKQLDELLRRYTEAHPDVISARQTIRQLEVQRTAELAAAKAKGRRAGSAATSPVFQRIRVSLADAEANVASLGSQLAAQRTRLTDLRGTASKVPQAEAELAQLNRDYDVIRHNYELLVSRREAASLGVKMDESAQLADFRVIEPPHVTPKAVFPDRKALAFLFMLASLGVGIGLAYALNLAYPTFSTPKQLEAVSRRPVIGMISSVTTAAIVSARRSDLQRVVLVMAAFFVTQGIWIALVTKRLGHIL